MNSAVLDASALLVLLNREPGAERLTARILNSAVVSAVNIAEVYGKLIQRGLDPAQAWFAALSPVREIAPFATDDARSAGALVSTTQTLGLSLGDRACLALGLALSAPVYTADRSWKNLSLGIRIHVIR